MIEHSQNKLRFAPAPRDGGFSMPDHWTWDNAVVRGEDGRYHLFTTCWPKTTPYSPYWLYLTRIIRCVSDDPAGPYVLEQTCFPDQRVRDRWDGMACHNPAVVRWRDTWYLFYRGLTYDGPEPGPDHPEPDVSDRFWRDWERKAIGVAWSRNITGPWERSAEPILSPRPDAWDRQCNSNPAPVILPDGTTYVLFKTATDRRKRFHLGVARAAHPLGPYEKLNNGPILQNITGVDDPNYEDPFLWHDGARFHLLAKDMSGNTCGEYHGGIHATSDDCVNWQLVKPRLAYSRRITWDNGETEMMGSFERPWLLIEDGQPTYLFGSVANGPGGFWNAPHTWIAALPIR